MGSEEAGKAAVFGSCHTTARMRRCTEVPEYRPAEHRVLRKGELLRSGEDAGKCEEQYSRNDSTLSDAGVCSFGR